MPLSINTNVESLNAQRNTALSNGSLAISMQRLASGLRVNSAADDAAGLAIGARFDAQVRGMNVGLRNANDGISMLQTADSVLTTASEMMQRMRELAVQAANATNSSGDRASLDVEYQALNAELFRIGQQPLFAGRAILGGGAGAQTFQIGANVSDTLSVTTRDFYQASIAAYNILLNNGGDADGLGGLSNAASARLAVSTIDATLAVVDADRASYGAALNRFDRVISNLQSGSANQAGARSRIMDADFATETANLSRAGILQRAGNAMVAQANQSPRGVLVLLQH